MLSSTNTMHNKPELQLIADFRNGDGDAIAELFQRHYASSLRVARRILPERDDPRRRPVGLPFGLPEFLLLSRRVELQDLDYEDRYKPMHDAPQEFPLASAMCEFGPLFFGLSSRNGCRSGANARGSRAKRRDPSEGHRYGWQASPTFTRRFCSQCDLRALDRRDC
jgi:hypothetical protein